MYREIVRADLAGVQDHGALAGRRGLTHISNEEDGGDWLGMTIWEAMSGRRDGSGGRDSLGCCPKSPREYRTLVQCRR